MADLPTPPPQQRQVQRLMPQAELPVSDHDAFVDRAVELLPKWLNLV